MVIDKSSGRWKFEVRGPRQKALLGIRPNSTVIRYSFDMKQKHGPAKGQQTLFDLEGVTLRARVEGEGFVPIEVQRWLMQSWG